MRRSRTPALALTWPVLQLASYQSGVYVYHVTIESNNVGLPALKIKVQPALYRPTETANENKKPSCC